jgi:hypothetical protein
MHPRWKQQHCVNDLATGLIHAHENLSSQPVACVSGFLIAVSKLHNGDV